MLMSVAVTALNSSANAQTISGVVITSKLTNNPDVNEYELKITGQGFGSDPRDVTVLVSPKQDITQPASVSEVSPKGTTISAHFLANSDFVASTVTVKTSSGQSEPFVMPQPSTGTGDLKKFVKVYRSIIDPKNVADMFGTRIAKRFIVVQVTITNRNKDFQFLIHDVSLDLKALLPGIKHPEASSINLTLLRGVAEKGQSLDKRNLSVRILRGMGTVAAGLIGVTDFGVSYAPSVAVFNGPFITAVTDIFPDYTIGQMNRLNDNAYIANTLIPKQQAKVLAIFLPQAILLNKTQSKQFWNDPNALLNNKEVDLRKIEIFVDGNFITEVEDLLPSITSAVIEPDEMKKFQGDNVEVKGYVSGNFLTGTDVKILNQDIPGLGIRLDGSPTDQRLNFIISSTLPICPGTVIKIGMVKKETTKPVDITVQYSPALPTLTNVAGPLKQGDKDATVTLTGTGFIPGCTDVEVTPLNTVKVGTVTVKSSQSLEVKLSPSDTAPATANIAVKNKTGIGSTKPLTITKK